MGSLRQELNALRVSFTTADVHWLIDQALSMLDRLDESDEDRLRIFDMHSMIQVESRNRLNDVQSLRRDIHRIEQQLSKERSKRICLERRLKRNDPHSCDTVDLTSAGESFASQFPNLDISPSFANRCGEEEQHDG